MHTYYECIPTNHIILLCKARYNIKIDISKQWQGKICVWDEQKLEWLGQGLRRTKTMRTDVNNSRFENQGILRHLFTYYKRFVPGKSFIRFVETAFSVCYICTRPICLIFVVMKIVRRKVIRSHGS